MGPLMQDVALRHVLPSDADWVAAACLVGLRTNKWGLGGRSPNPDVVRRQMWDRVLVQGVVEAPGPPATPLGLVQVHDADLQNGHAKLSLLAARHGPSDVAALQAGIGRLLRDVVRDFPLNKLYVEVLGDAEAEVGDLLPVPTTAEGRLREHERVGPDRYDDLHICAIAAADVRRSEA